MNNCLFDFGGHAKSDFPFQKQVVEGPERERESRKAPLINIFPSIPLASENTIVAGSQAEDELFEWATEQSPPAPEKTIVASSLVEDELIEWAIEQAPFLNIAEPKKVSWCKGGGSTFNDSVFKILVVKEPFCESLNERIKGRPTLITLRVITILAQLNRMTTQHFYCKKRF